MCYEWEWYEREDERIDEILKKIMKEAEEEETVPAPSQ